MMTTTKIRKKKLPEFQATIKINRTGKSRMFTVASILYVVLLVLSILFIGGANMAEPKSKDGALTVLFSRVSFDETKWMGKLNRETYSMENVIASILASNTGIDYAMISHAAELLQRQMISFLKDGKCVDVLGLCHAYILPKAKVKGDLPLPEDVIGFVPKFTASKLLRDEVANLKVSVTKNTDTGPVINQVTCLADGNTEGRIKAGRNVRLTGSLLTVGGEGAGIFFVPEKDGGKETSEEKWIKADISYLPKNTGKYVEFTAPANLTPDAKYWILLRSKVDTAGKARKTAVEAYSAQVTTVA